MYPTASENLSKRKCQECNFTHTMKFDCRAIRCLYCYKTHSIQELRDGICPEAYLATEQLRKAETLVCLECKGLGRYVSSEVKIITETKG